MSAHTTSKYGHKIYGDTNTTNYALTQETNESNQQIAQQANEYNYRMFKEQQDFNLEMWNKENQYNTPAAQAERYRQAGFNPYMMGVDAGSASSVQSVSPPTATAIPNQAPSVSNDDYRLMLEGLGQATGALQTGISMQKASEEVKQLQIDNATRGARALQEIDNLRETNKGTKLDNDMKEIQKSVLKDSLNYDLESKRLTNDGLALDYVMKSYQSAMMPEQLQLGMATGVVQLMNGILDGQLKGKQIDFAALQMVTEQIKQSGMKIDNDQKLEMKDWLVKQAEFQAKRAENNMYPQDAWQESYQYGAAGATYRGVSSIGQGLKFIPRKSKSVAQ